MEENIFLILHGWGGNSPEHWQEHLYTLLVDSGFSVYYPEMPNSSTPEPASWLGTIRKELNTLRRRHPEGRLTVLAHSLGSIAWMHLVGGCAADSDPLSERALLVAPPYILPQAPPPDAPHSAALFFPPPMLPSTMHSVSPNTVIIASDNDDYSTFDQSSGYAEALHIPIYKMHGAGHISPYYGYGKWPWIEDWCLDKADFPPQARP